MAGSTRWVRFIVPGISVPGGETRVLATQALGSGGLSLRNATVVRSMGRLRAFNADVSGISHGTVFDFITETPIAALVDQPTFDFSSRSDASFRLLTPFIAGPRQVSLDALGANTSSYDAGETTVVSLESKAERRVLGTAEMTYTLMCSNESTIQADFYGTLSLLFHLA